MTTPEPQRDKRLIALILAVPVLALFTFLVVIAQLTAGRTTVDYSLFRAQVDADNVAEVTSTVDTIEGEFREPIAVPDGDSEVTRFRTERPSFADDGLAETLVANDVVVRAEPDRGEPFWQRLLAVMLPVVLITVVFGAILLGRGGGFMSLGKSKEDRYDGAERGVTFADVAGIEEVEQELVELVEFLREPERFQRLGARVPRGVLLAGPPGTGKTLLARALAGEAGVPFFSVGGSSFNEMLIGVGASRVRELFAKARKAAPAIVFIDELDAVGGKRSSSAVMGDKELQNTLNQVLIELDGFSETESVIVVGATNRPDSLDPALLRPGRFDRRLTVHPPDHAGRRKILEVHSVGVPLADDVDLDVIAATTPGMVGAELGNLVNEAAIAAARRHADAVTADDLHAALERVVLGAERQVVIAKGDRERTAYHESGHALVGMLVPGADPVRKISIIPRGRSLGATYQSPDADRYGHDENQLRARIVGLLGGRAAEQLVFGDVTTGAEDDIEQATIIARLMVGRWGMTEALGPVAVLERERLGPLGGAGTVADATMAIVDTEVRKLVDSCLDEAKRLLEEHRQSLDDLAAALLDRETLDQADAYAIVGHPDVSELDAADANVS